ncbi:hypothetical protein CIPAW_15G178500 [Carya illinoinensis]|uniref:TIR domain-containing protein n=1 Tax=Carya illinoinensis TaxID=32201 RepID=A0A8T1NG95_CARIL|nr:hypothetical protein CIPAW_15G178500 [Carya illinoinensis]
MASSSSSSSVTSPWRYDVFLSFRGDDTRDTFTAHLYRALTQKEILTFIDKDELRRGDEISPALLQAIEGSRISIIVLSTNYASSTWCLDELLKILECKKSKQQRVLPVFYHIDPSDVRHQRGSFGEALAKHAEKLNVDMKLQLWKEALREVAGILGYPLINGHEANLIEEIVQEVSRIANDHFFLPVAKHPVGLEPHLKDVDLLSVETNDIRMIGIFGVGGIDMGREVVRQESLKNPGARSRLFLHEDVREVLENDTGTDNVEGIVVDFPKGDDIIRLSPKAFKKMKRLRLFRCRNAHFSEELNFLPNSIRVLDWPNCPLQSMPSKFRGDKLSILLMPGSSKFKVSKFEENKS